MKRRSNDWIVGATVLGGMALVVVVTMWLQQADIGQQRVEVTARFREVGNMAVGNAVVIRGVRAGRVDDIHLADSGWVTTTLLLDPGIQLPPNPVVLTQASTLFGEWQAVITQRDAVPAIREVVLQLQDSAGAPANTLAGAVLPDIAQLTSVAGGIAGNVASVAERVRTAFDDSAARELRTTIRNLSVMSTELTRTVRLQSQNLDMIAAQVRAGVGDLSSGAAALQRSVGRLDSATSAGEIARIVADAQAAAADLRQMSGRLNEMSESLMRAENSLSRAITKADTLLGRVERGEGSLGLLFNDPSLYRNTDSLLVDLRVLLSEFRANPKRFVNLSIF
ncbi:MAG: MCE family protein [Gemmatimonadaceae bacterium]|nr:MCE family protein [Gemmatimonadaceae bacterium]